MGISSDEVPSDISESLVIVTFLDVQPVKVTQQNMYFGMLSTSNQHSTKEDFKIGEFHDDVNNDNF